VNNVLAPNAYKGSLNAVFTLCPGPVSLEDAMTNSATYLEQTAEQVARAFPAHHGQ